jgi:hypothetical protein
LPRLKLEKRFVSHGADSYNLRRLCSKISVSCNLNPR